MCRNVAEKCQTLFVQALDQQKILINTLITMKDHLEEADEYLDSMKYFSKKVATTAGIVMALGGAGKAVAGEIEAPLGIIGEVELK